MALEYEKLREDLQEIRRRVPEGALPDVVEKLLASAQALCDAVGDPNRQRNYRVTVEIDVLARSEAEAAEIGFNEILTLNSPVVTVVPTDEPPGQWERDPDDLDWREHQP